MAESHADQTNNHKPFADVYADAAARAAATGFPRGVADAIIPFDASDVGKVAWQTDDDSIWILTAITPTWIQIDGVGWAAALAAHEAASDPHIGYQKESEKGAASGYASLDGSGLVPVAQLPALAITDVFPVASQAAMLALTAEKGDVAIRSDNGNSYILSTNSPSTLADWKQITISGGVPGSHASTHQNGGADEIDLTGLSGLLADPQIPTGSAGGDLSGTYPDPTVKTNLKTVTVNFVIDGGGSAIAAGIKGDLQIDFAGTIQSATLLADQVGSIVIDIWKDTYANFPPTDTITASAKPTLSGANKSTDSTLTGWTTSVSAGDILRFNVDSAATVTRVTIALKILQT